MELYVWLLLLSHYYVLKIVFSNLAYSLYIIYHPSYFLKHMYKTFFPGPARNA